jgi:putative exporter of polyketide antibiotics
VVVVTVLLSIATAIGAAAGGSTAGDGILGVASLGLYAAAIVGIGVAVGGLWRTSIAAEVAALVVVATFLLDLLAPPLNLPDWMHQLALTSHFGQPMIGNWDPVGVVLCVGIAVGGIALGALGVRRRDIER